MTTTLAVYANADDALLLWSAAALADDCDGFAVQRKFNGETDWLDNFAPPGPQDHQQGRMHPSNERPFRRFSWTDHAVGPGDKVSYRVMPVRAGKPKSGEASKWSKARTIGAPGGAYTPYFNRGFVISQFMARYLAEHFPGMPLKDALPLFKDQLGMHENAIRRFLSGQLRDHVLEFVRGLAADEQLHGALYELKDEELEDALCALGPRAHIVLANGSIKKRKNETSAQARTRDQNKPARDKLEGHQVDVSGRFISPGALGHNKFLVAVGPNDHARRVWTGSTNWTTTGLCTQLNNGLLIEDEPVAAAYLEQWKALKQAGNEHPKTLTTSNGTPIAAGKLTAHFTRVSGKVDLAALEEIVRGANEGIHFLMFQPGGTGVVAAIREFAAAHPDRLARGVISTLPKGDEDEHTGTTTTVEVTLFGDPNDPDPAPRTFDVVQPQGFAHVAAGWAEEVTRAQFLDRGHGIGNAIIHSKVLVVDPFSDSPTVVTGSHNFSSTASTDNDENFVVIRGDKALAEAYIVNIESAWQHYAPRIGMRHRDKTGIDYLRALLADQAPERAFWRLA
jgi:phosphatidylserine/phosphatidylglycerophosphate/cardiolipin synthase-like enzyme